MTGIYADNQPDFTWLKPYEEKTFTQYFMPYKHVGRVKNATKDASVNLELEGHNCIIKAYASGVFPQCQIKVCENGETIFADQADLSPTEIYDAAFTTELDSLTGCTLTITDVHGNTLVSYTAVEQELEATPDPADPLLPPSELKSTEELYLGALHLEQYRHATFSPDDYYLEGLRRDPSDIRLNNGYRNLAIAYYNKEHDISKALPAMKRAVELDPDYSRFLLEYDQLCAKAGYSNEDRLKLLEAHIDLVTYRDALYLEYITLLNNTGQYDKALDCLTTHQFHPWEGGEGKVSAQYRYALTQKAVLLLNRKHYEEAISLLEKTKTYPQNLGEGKLPNVQDNIADYYLGIAYEETGNKEAATAHYLAASVGLDEPGSVLYYNDQPSDTILYQGFANEKLGNTNAARKCYHQLLSFGQKHLFDKVGYDYFAVSLPEIEVFPSNIQDRNDTYCHYLMGLAYIGLKEYEKAENELHEILKEQPGYQGAIQHLMMI